MAALLVVLGGAMLAERVEKSKEKKRLKKELDEMRYQELVEETGRRLSRTDSSGGQVIRNGRREGDGDDVACEDGEERGGGRLPGYEVVGSRRDSAVDDGRQRRGGEEEVERRRSLTRQSDGSRKRKGIKGIFGKK
ncbi:hypothetical protein CERZMDRAFT_81354 [Cercospora zeae-maydis SCOH1-5]|uniref:Uncharacterized protein n=1 Tax=Cercospora zeae-maydis SCOH1-5 TaxID=717836 RepID=A0A6A6FS06_9PEZI|nr:hypothetical protein CERZMDRAFT_81354 [Cercospora zeae-maydis SCOH1-5]